MRLLSEGKEWGRGNQKGKNGLLSEAKEWGRGWEKKGAAIRKRNNGEGEKKGLGRGKKEAAMRRDRMGLLSEGTERDCYQKGKKEAIIRKERKGLLSEGQERGYYQKGENGERERKDARRGTECMVEKERDIGTCRRRKVKEMLHSVGINLTYHLNQSPTETEKERDIEGTTPDVQTRLQNKTY